jgi:hypothetical protein
MYFSAKVLATRAAVRGFSDSTPISMTRESGTGLMTSRRKTASVTILRSSAATSSGSGGGPPVGGGSMMPRSRKLSRAHSGTVTISRTRSTKCHGWRAQAGIELRVLIEAQLVHDRFREIGGAQDLDLVLQPVTRRRSDRACADVDELATRRIEHHLRCRAVNRNVLRCREVAEGSREEHADQDDPLAAPEPREDRAEVDDVVIVILERMALVGTRWLHRPVLVFLHDVPRQRTSTNVAALSPIAPANDRGLLPLVQSSDILGHIA